MQLKHEQMLLTAFRDIMKEYALVYTNIDDQHQALFYRPGYGLRIFVYRDEMSCDYIHRSPSGAYGVYDLWNYCMNQSDDEDRKGLFPVHTIDERIQSYFISLARVLKRHFPYILEGDTSWFGDFCKDPWGGEPWRAHADLVEAMQYAERFYPELLERQK